MVLMQTDWMFLIGKIVLISIILMVSLGIAAYATWGERKVAAIMQDRLGPSRAGIFGLLQPLADGLKLFFKEEIIPDKSTRLIFIMGPCLFMTTALMTSAVIPWGPPIKIGDSVFTLQVADINVSILFVFGIVSLGVYGIMLGGWASNNKFSLLSSIRSASQAISYELAMGLSLIALLMVCSNTENPLSLHEMVKQQHDTGLWNVIKQPLGFLIFMTCSFAELNRAPFDLPECESELNMGYHQEYSSMKLGLYLFAEYINMFISSAIMATLFFGGYNYPWMDQVQAALGEGSVLFALTCVTALMIKIVGFILFFMFIRWTLPRFRYDQLMNLGWKGLIPLALFNMVITGGAILCFFNK